jgi:alkane 1-monooxygenase
MILQALLPFLFLALVPLFHWISATAPGLVPPVLLVTFLTLDGWMGAANGETNAGQSWIYRLPLWLYVPTLLAVILWGIVAASASDSVGEFLGLALSTGIMTGIFGMLTAHELIHSRSPTERALGVAMLCGATYPHFRISHLHGHHRIAATRDDPASARRGESAYRFVLRSVTGQLVQAWGFERRRVLQGRLSILANRLYLYLAIIAALIAVIAICFGWRGIVFQLVQSLVAIFILELFNYIAHYGLERRQTAAGRLEPLGPNHSWNAMQRFNNLALLNGGYHTHHHQAPMASYQNLHGGPDLPMLPAGFAGSILLSMFPRYWHRVMDPRVDLWQGTPATPDRSGGLVEGGLLQRSGQG